MPQLYPTKTPSKKVNFVSDGPSDIPRLVEDNPTDFLHSRYFHANIKEKSRLSLPPNFKSKEEFAKTAPEKQKPPTMSVSYCNTVPELLRDEKLFFRCFCSYHFYSSINHTINPPSTSIRNICCRCSAEYSWRILVTAASCVLKTHDCFIT